MVVEELSDAVETSTIVPTGGFRLRRDGLDMERGRLRIRYTLDEPGTDEMVTQSLVRLTDRVEFPTPGSAEIGRIEVMIARVQRGVAYLIPPAHELAAVLER